MSCGQHTLPPGTTQEGPGTPGTGRPDPPDQGLLDGETSIEYGLNRNVNYLRLKFTTFKES